jgi:single-stranded-DNA-specific exonuclease
LLAGFGGHKAAAGVRLPAGNLDAFREQFDRAMAAQPVVENSLQLDAHLTLEDLGLAVIEDLERLGPYGVENPEPVVGLRVRAESLGRIKEQHLKLALRSTQSGDAEPVEGIWFRAPAEVTWDAAKLVECAVIPEVNRFRGRKRPVLRIKSLRV